MAISTITGRKIKDEEVKSKGLPEVLHPAVTGAKYTGAIEKPKERSLLEGIIKSAGLKPIGITEPKPEIKTETKPKPITTEIKTEVKPSGVSLPYGYEKDITGKVFTESDLPTQEELAGGGFGYVRGLPEAGIDLKGFYTGTMQKLTDRASRIADTIEAGFYEGKRLTAAVEELKTLQSGILEIGTLVQGMETAGTEAAYKKALTGKTEAETRIIPETPEAAKEMEKEIRAAGITPSKGLFEIGYSEYLKGRNRLMSSSEYLMADESTQKKLLTNYEAQYPEYSGSASTITKPKYKRDAQGNVYIEE